MNSPTLQAQRELDSLRAEVDNDTLNDSGSTQTLTRLKVLARDPTKAPCIYQKDGLKVLARIAFGQDERKVSSLEAARIIANALLLQDQTQQMFADLGFLAQLITFYSKTSADHEFVGGRILFLLTYKSNVDFGDLIQNHQLVDHINAHLSRHMLCISAGEYAKHPMTNMALTETLKLIYNVVNKVHAQQHHFTQLVPELIRITSTITIPPQPLDAPITQLLNALGIVEWPPSLVTETDDFGSMDALSRRLVDIVDKSMASLSTTQLENMLIAPLTVLRKIILLANEKVNDLLRKTLLPRDEERDKPLGHSESLASRLLRLQSSAGVIVLPEAISGLLFDLSDRDASKFVRNIGYGHAAGYLMTHQIAVPDELTTNANQSTSITTDVEINPITGQRRDAEPTTPMPQMTDEEKEREAQRLFVLFERLKATGVVNVENPIRTAQQTGRFEELSDSEPD